MILLQLLPLYLFSTWYGWNILGKYLYFLFVRKSKMDGLNYASHRNKGINLWQVCTQKKKKIKKGAWSSRRSKDSIPLVFRVGSKLLPNCVVLYFDIVTRSKSNGSLLFKTASNPINLICTSIVKMFVFLTKYFNCEGCSQSTIKVTLHRTILVVYSIWF